MTDIGLILILHILIAKYIYNNNMPNHLILDPGEYTMVYSTASTGDYSSDSIEEYISSLILSTNYSSFFIDLSLTMYDGNCFKQGCMDLNALNYDHLATSQDNCDYPLYFGVYNVDNRFQYQIYFRRSLIRFYRFAFYVGFNFEVETDSTLIEIDSYFESYVMVIILEA